MASLATYFGLGKQRHRSLDDVRLNLEVLKYCAAVLFLESNLPDVFSVTSWDNMEGPSTRNPRETFRTLISTSNGRNSYSGYLEPNEVSPDCINVLNDQSGWRILIHNGAPLRLCSMGVRVQYGISSRFHDNAGRPKLSFVINIPTSLCRVLELCEHVTQKSSIDSGGNSEWMPVMRKDVYSNSSSVRLHLPRVANGDAPIFSAEIYQREASGNIKKFIFSKSDVSELELLLVPGTNLDAFFSVDVYDYQQYAGIRLVAKRLVLYSK